MVVVHGRRAGLAPGWQGSWPVAAAGLARLARLAPAASVDAPHALGHDVEDDGSGPVGPGSRSAVAVRVREDGDHCRLQVVAAANAGEHLPLISLKSRPSAARAAVVWKHSFSFIRL